jgi:hypothetical protein
LGPGVGDGPDSRSGRWVPWVHLHGGLGRRGSSIQECADLLLERREVVRDAPGEPFVRSRSARSRRPCPSRFRTGLGLPPRSHVERILDRGPLLGPAGRRCSARGPARRRPGAEASASLAFPSISRRRRVNTSPMRSSRAGRGEVRERLSRDPKDFLLGQAGDLAAQARVGPLRMALRCLCAQARPPPCALRRGGARARPWPRRSPWREERYAARRKPCSCSESRHALLLRLGLLASASASSAAMRFSRASMALRMGL